MRDFTYQDLDIYAEIRNAVEYHLDEVTEAMRGAYPDNSGTPDLDYAVQQATLLKANAEALLNDVTALRAAQNC